MEQPRILICRFCRIALRLTCIWPPEKIEIRPGVGYYVTIVIALCLTFNVLFLFLIRHFLITLQANMNLIEDVAAIAVFVEIYLIFVLYVFNQPKISRLMVDLSNFDKFGKPPGFEKLNRRLDFSAKLVLAYVFLAVSAASVSKIREIPQCQARGLHENCGVLVSSSTPKILSKNETPWLFASYLIYEYAVIATYVKLSLMVSYHLYEICEHIILRIEHLNLMLLECLNNSKEPIRLNTCIAYHIQIIEFFKKTNECFTYCMFVRITVTVIVLATIESHIVHHFEIRYLVLILGWILGLVLICYGGQHLTDASLAVGDVVFSSEWYKTDYKLQKKLILVIMRTQLPLRITTGPFNYLSFALFLSIMKASYTFFTLVSSK